MAQNAPNYDALIQALITAAQAATAAAIPPVAPPVPFALLPGAAYTAPLDYSKASELKIFRASTSGMDDKFDLKEDHLRVFIETVKEHVRTYNWMTIVTIPDDNAVDRNLITNYGQLTLANVNAHAIGYMTLQTRDAQNSMLLYKYLLNSLTEDAKLVMVTMAHQYHANNMPSGPLFLKSIIGRASIDTKAKILLLRESVSHLHMKMVELKGNVREFNQHVAELRTSLEGRGQDVSELIMHLFKAYEQVPDQQFNRYIEAIRDRYDADIEDITAEQLMLLAVNKFDLLTQRNAMPIDNVDKIVALQTKVNDHRTNERGGRRNRVVPAWKKIPPAAGEPSTKTMDGKVYHFCPNHKAWCIHTVAQCTMVPTTSAAAISTIETPAAEQDRLVINRAYHAIIKGLDDEDEDE
jgi:hypothetical protein